MAKLSVYYVEHEDGLAPRFLCVWFGKEMINWKKTHVYIPINTPFKRKLSEEFDLEVLSLSIASTELLLNPERPGQFGIHIPTVQKRLNKLRSDSMSFIQSDIEQFIIQICDIEEILQMEVRGFYKWKD
jgi:hypothetical protein